MPARSWRGTGRGIRCVLVDSGLRQLLRSFEPAFSLVLLILSGGSRRLVLRRLVADRYMDLRYRRQRHEAAACPNGHTTGTRGDKLNWSLICGWLDMALTSGSGMAEGSQATESPAPDEQEPLDYDAFLSYTHSDRPVAAQFRRVCTASAGGLVSCGHCGYFVTTPIWKPIPTCGAGSPTRWTAPATWSWCSPRRQPNPIG